LIAHRESSPAAFERAVSAATTLVTELAQAGRPVELRVVWPSVLGPAGPAPEDRDPAAERRERVDARARARAAEATRTVRGSRAALDELAAVQPRVGDLRGALEALGDLRAGTLVVLGLDGVPGLDGGRHPWFGPLAAASRALWLVCEQGGEPVLVGPRTRSRRGVPRHRVTTGIAL